MFWMKLNSALKTIDDALLLKFPPLTYFPSFHLHLVHSSLTRSGKCDEPGICMRNQQVIACSLKFARSLVDRTNQENIACEISCYRRTKFCVSHFATLSSSLWPAREYGDWIEYCYSLNSFEFLALPSPPSFSPPHITTCSVLVK